MSQKSRKSGKNRAKMVLFHLFVLGGLVRIQISNPDAGTEEKRTGLLSDWSDSL
jgi:hypothetical protein